jgi:hypothetical protein
MESRIEKRWALPTFIAAGVLALLFFAGSRLGSLANARAELPAPASPDASRGGGQPVSNSEIMVVPIQIERDRYGIAMVDMVNQTLWIYEINSMGPPYNRLKLLAARSWQYDRLLKQYNTAEPKPEQVKMLLEEKKSEKQPNSSNKEEQIQEQKTGSDVNIAEANAAEVNEPNE